MSALIPACTDSASSDACDVPFEVILFYKYVRIDRFALEAYRDRLLTFCQRRRLIGRIRLSVEGINGTLAGGREDVDGFIVRFESDGGEFDGAFVGIDYKRSQSPRSAPPFVGVRVVLTAEVTSTGPCMENVDLARFGGGHLSPREFHAKLLSPSPHQILLDARNHYEAAVGKFDGAVDGKIRAFNQFANFVEQNIDTLRQSEVLMYCTGGVRCEKAAAYLRSRGCAAVAQLRGGIHRYMEEFADDQTSQWRGLCTVFDERIAVGCESSGKSLGKCIMCATHCHVPTSNRRCIECRCLVLYCQDCFALTPWIQVQRQRYSDDECDDDDSASCDQVSHKLKQLYCEEHVLMSADISVQDRFLARLSVAELTALHEQLLQCIKFATPNRRNGKGRRSRNRRHQLTTQAAAVQRHMTQRANLIPRSDDDAAVDKRSQDTLVPFMPLLNV